MGVTIPVEIRDQLEAAASKAGRSIGEEIRLRLERTFQQDAKKFSATGGLLNRIFALAAMVEFATGRKWNEDPGVGHVLQLTVDRLFQRLGTRDVGEIETIEAFRREFVAHTDPVQLATAIEMLTNAKLVMDIHLDEAYGRGHAAEGERLAAETKKIADEVYRTRETK